MDMYEPITVARDVEGILIPNGTPVTVPADSVVYVTQALGGSVTVNLNGNLVRLAGKDLDAIGMEPEKPPVTDENLSAAEVEALAWDQMRGCYDPEIPINIVELGLVYHCDLTPLEQAAEDGGRRYRLNVAMTLTAPGCGMGEILVEDVRQRLELIPQVDDAEVELVFDPPWSQEMMSEAARLQVGLF